MLNFCGYCAQGTKSVYPEKLAQIMLLIHESTSKAILLDF